jgi:hypothetical protein
MALPSNEPEDPVRSPGDTPIDTPVTGTTIESLRTRLTGARAQRGACPTLAALKQDLLPAHELAPGRDERMRHVERCPVCAHRVRAWRTSWEGRGAVLLAIAKLTGGHLARRTARALSALSKNKDRGDREEKAKPGREAIGAVLFPSPAADRMPRVHAPAAAASPDFDPLDDVPPLAQPLPAHPQPAPPPPLPPREPASSDYWASSPPVELPAPARGRSPRGTGRPRKTSPFHHETLPPILVFEAPPPGVTPRALIDATVARGGAVVSVESVEEIFGDADFGSVRAIVLTRARPLAEWPMAIQRVRQRAPGRVVLAVVPVPRFGPSAVTWARDPAILLPPVSEKDWNPALHRAGWLAPA